MADDADHAPAPVTEPTGAPPRATLDALLVRWLVRFNPLYVASAALVLAGAWQVSVGLEERRLEDGRVLPALILAAYQALLVGAAWVLSRRERLVRPAVILALVELLFFLDPTFQLTTIAVDASRPVGLLAAAGSVLLVPLLLLPLLRALRLRAPAQTLAAPVALVLAIALGPQLLDAELLPRDTTFLALAAWGLGLTVWLIRRPLQIELDEARPPAPAADDWARTVRDRIARALPIAWLLTFWAHAIGWSVIFDVVPGAPVAFLAACTLLLAARHEGNIWLGAGLATLIALDTPARFGEAALLLAILLLARWWSSTRAAPSQAAASQAAAAQPAASQAPRLSRRLLIGAVLELWLAATAWGWLGGDFPDATPLVTLVVVALLLALALRHRAPAALWPVPLLLLATRWPSLPSSGLGALGRGALLLGAGFLALALGVLANVLVARRRGRPQRV